MSQKTDAQLTAEAEVIRNETASRANTKTRVSTILEDIIDSKPNNSVTDAIQLQVDGLSNYDGDPTVIVQDATHRFVSDTEKSTWNGKQDTLPAASQAQVDAGTATDVYVDPATLQDRDDDAVALVDGATIDITGPKHTLTTATGRTFTISHPGDDMILEITLNDTSATFTFPAATKCWVEGVASNANTMALSGTSGDKYVVPIFKIGSNYYAASKNSNR